MKVFKTLKEGLDKESIKNALEESIKDKKISNYSIYNSLHLNPGNINSYIKNMFAQDFVLNKVSVQGEVSNCKYHSGGRHRPY